MNKFYWVKFTEIKLTNPIIKLPKAIYPYPATTRWLFFGTKQETCYIEKTNEEVFLDQNSYNNPLVIPISSSLVEALILPLGIIYQIHISKQHLEIGPTIGLLLGERNHLYHPDYMEKYNDRFGVYHRIGGVTVAFSLRSLNWDNNQVYGFIFDPEQNKWIYGTTVIPSTIYRRNFHQNQENMELIREKTNDRIFNSIRITKLDLYNILLKNEKFTAHLPKTFLLANFEEMKDFLDQQKKIILKPTSLSRGRGIVIIEINPNIKDEYIFHDYRDKKRPMSYSLTDKKIEKILIKERFFEGKYLYQSYIPLAKINHSPFDIRVVMQKTERKKWQCSGIECRIAGDREQITNISRGGSAKTLEESIKLLGDSYDYHTIHQKIINISQDFCNWMDLQGEHFAEFGIDIGLDVDGFPWFIEANVFPSFKGFKTLDYKQYLRIRHQPLLYAASLQGFYPSKGVEKNEVNDRG